MELRDRIEAISECYDSFYLYDESSILHYTKKLKEHFPSVEFLYSMKCNSHSHVLNCVFSQGFGADAASLGEVKLAAESGLPRQKIYYSAPGKTLEDIENALEQSVLIADSVGEVARIREAARKRNATARIGIRVNPNFTLCGPGGTASKFGIDEAQALELAEKENRDYIKIVGIHIHVKSQELDAEVLGAYYKNVLRLAETFYTICGGLEFVNMGSGIGIPYGAEDTEPDMAALGKTVEDALVRFRESCPGTKVFMETGRYAVCKAGYYVTKVIDRKESYGKTYLILKNTLNGFARPSLEKLVLRYAAEENPPGMEPLYTCRNAFNFVPSKAGDPVEQVTLAGNLCTAADVVAEDILLPRLEPGDWLMVTNAGSYAAVLSPMQFSSQEKPVELFLTREGKVL